MKRAFTLIEVMLALSLLLVISSTLFGFMLGMMDRRERLIDAARDGRSGSALIERLENDVLGAIAGDSGVGAGIKGDSTSLTVLTRAVNVPGVAAELDIALGDLQASRYSFSEQAGEVSIARWGVSPTGSAGATTGPDEVVSSRVRRLRFRYHDGDSWLSSFDSLSERGLPVAIEIAVWFGETQQARIEANAPTELMGDETALQFGDDFASDAGFEAGFDAGQMFLEEDEPIVWGQPDRVRMIIVPDGPVAAWKEGR